MIVINTNFNFLKHILQDAMPWVFIEEVSDSIDYIDKDGNVLSLQKYRVAVQSYNDSLLRIGEAIYNLKQIIGNSTHIIFYTGNVNQFREHDDINSIHVYMHIDAQ
jgi:hypothetical protein